MQTLNHTRNHSGFFRYTHRGNSYPLTQIWIICIVLLLASCVQSTRTRVVVVTLDVSGRGPIEKVGVRGEGNPLSWREDYLLTPIVKDSLYTATIIGHTPYDFTEIKFTVNGQFELENQDNRRVVFTGDTTYYRAKFNTMDAGAGKP